MNIESKELFINIKMKKNEKKKHLSTKYIYGFNFHHSAISKSMHIMFLKSEKKKSLKSNFFDTKNQKTCLKSSKGEKTLILQKRMHQNFLKNQFFFSFEMISNIFFFIFGVERFSTLVNFLLDFKNVIIELYNNKLL